MKNSKIGLIIIAVIAVIAIILIGGYNSIIAASEEVENKFSTIDTQLQFSKHSKRICKSRKRNNKHSNNSKRKTSRSK